VAVVKKRQMGGLELSKGSETVPIARIVKAAELQVRSGVNAGTVRDYADKMRGGVVFPAVELAEVDGKLLLVDGWHRLAALERLERREAEALVTPMTMKDAIWAAARANLGHGRPLARGDHRRVFRAYVSAGQHRTKAGGFKTYREIAGELGAGRAHTTIRNWMKKDFPGVARRMTGHGEPLAGDIPLRDSDALLNDHAHKGLGILREALNAMTRPDDRWRVMEAAKDLLRDAVAEGGAGTPQEDPDF
jgi:hypothetical protein